MVPQTSHKQLYARHIYRDALSVYPEITSGWSAVLWVRTESPTVSKDTVAETMTLILGDPALFDVARRCSWTINPEGLR